MLVRITATTVLLMGQNLLSVFIILWLEADKKYITMSLASAVIRSHAGTVQKYSAGPHWRSGRQAS